jgi:hypothetical protein
LRAALPPSRPPLGEGSPRWLVMPPRRQGRADRLEPDLPELNVSYAGPERGLVKLRFKSIDTWLRRTVMAQEYKPGQIVPQSGVYTITHGPVHADMPHEVTVIKGRRFPTCRHCKGISFDLAHAAKHVGEIDHLEEAHAPAH